MSTGRDPFEPAPLCRHGYPADCPDCDVPSYLPAVLDEPAPVHAALVHVATDAEPDEPALAPDERAELETAVSDELERIRETGRLLPKRDERALHSVHVDHWPRDEKGYGAPALVVSTALVLILATLAILAIGRAVDHELAYCGAAIASGQCEPAP